MANYYNDTIPQIGTPTNISTTSISPDLVLKSWAKKTWEAGIKESYFSKFMGRDAKSIIHVKEDLSRGKGTSINIPLLMPLVGAGIIDDNLLEGNEEPLVYREFDVFLHQIRHAVRLQGRFMEKKVQQNLREDARSALSEWLAGYIDRSIFAVLTGTLPPFAKDSAGNQDATKFPWTVESPSSDRLVYAGGKTRQAQITPADKFEPALIGKAKRLARADESTAIRPVRVNGHETYVMVIDQWQARDLKQNEDWIRAQESANIRGEKNPIFSGALGIWDGVVIHECNRVPRLNVGVDGTYVGRALFLGAQACVFAEGEAPRWVQKNFDYENQFGVSISRMFGLKKARFNFYGDHATDFGVINVITSSVEDS